MSFLLVSTWLLSHLSWVSLLVTSDCHLLIRLFLTSFYKIVRAPSLTFCFSALAFLFSTRVTTSNIYLLVHLLIVCLLSLEYKLHKSRDCPFCALLYTITLEQCLAQTRCSFIEWMNDEWMNTRQQANIHANLPFIQGVVVNINQEWKLGLKQDLKAAYRQMLMFPLENSITNVFSHTSPLPLTLSVSLSLMLKAGSWSYLSLFSSLVQWIVQSRFLINICSQPRNGQTFVSS